MSLKSQIETAKDAVSKALITALENKDESAVSNLITCYNTLSNTNVKYSFTIGGTSGIHVNPYDNINIPCSMNDDVISFTGLG
jgi:uncharacterized protein (UPF0333 family)